MDIVKIAKAAQKFVGKVRDFRNFCKPDDSPYRPDDEEQNFMRRMYLFQTVLVVYIRRGVHIQTPFQT